MQTNCAPNRNTHGIVSIQNVSYVGVDRKGAEFIGNKQTNSPTHSLTHRRKDTQLYISVQTDYFAEFRLRHETVLSADNVRRQIEKNKLNVTTAWTANWRR